MRTSLLKIFKLLRKTNFLIGALVVCLFFLNSVHLFSQHSYKKINIDSLLSEIKLSQENRTVEKEIQLHQEVAFQYQIRRDLINALATFNQLAELTSKHKKDSLYFNALDNIAATYFHMKDENKCDSICSILKTSKNVPDVVLGSAFYFPALFAEHKGEYEYSEKEYKTALELYKTANDSIKIPLVLRHLGTIYKRQGKPAKSLQSYIDAIPYYKEGSRSHVLVINLYNSINNIFYQHKNYLQAFEYSSRILNLLHLVRKEEHKQFYSFLHAKNLEALNKQSVADSLYSISHEYFTTSSSESSLKLLVLVGLLGSTLHNNDLAKSKFYIDLLKDDVSGLKPSADIHSLANLKLNNSKFKSEYYLRSRDFTKLKEELEYIGTNLQANEDLELSYIFHKYSYEFFNQQGDSALALKHFEEAQILKDSMYRNDQMILLQDMEYRYQKADQKNQITLLSTENELSSLRVQFLNRRNFLFGSALVLFSILSLFLYFLYQNVRRKNKVIKLADEEKTVLLHEIHHRVKNNLQVISSLLALQGKYVSDNQALDALKQGQDRVQSMALIHQDLYQTNNLKGVNTQVYFEQVVDNLFDSYNISDDKIQLELEIAPLMLDVDTMIPLGLIVNELVSNSLKHAFEKEDTGKIKIILLEKNQELVLTVSDNGKGVVSLAELEGKSFGYDLIKAFAKKLKAQIVFDIDHGFVTKLRIKNYKIAA